MNNMTALYVYSPTTFKTNKKIEPMSGASHPPGEVQLQPGIYRVKGEADVKATNDPTASNHSIITFDTKNGFPDPPKAAMQLSNMTADDLRNFFDGAGDETNLPES